MSSQLGWSILSRRSLLRSLILGMGAVSVAGANVAQGDARLERLFTTFMAPCCWQQNLLVHESPKSDEVRTEIRKMVQDGLGDDQIKSAMVSKFSTRILAMPEGAKGQWLSWTPWVAVSTGAAFVVVLMRRSLRRQPASSATPAGPQVDLSDLDLD